MFQFPLRNKQRLNMICAKKQTYLIDTCSHMDRRFTNFIMMIMMMMMMMVVVVVAMTIVTTTTMATATATTMVMI